MAIATITSKGQTTIPKEIRDRLDLQPNDKLHFTALEDGTVILRAKKRSLSEAFGILRKRDRKTLPLSEMKR